MLTSQNRYKKGILTIEILIVVAIIAITLTSLLGLVGFSLRVITLTKESTLADALTKEVIEAVRNFRDETTWNIDGLGSLTTGISYYPQKTAETPLRWTFAQGEEIIGNFCRKIIFEKVFRDENDNIATSGTEDPDTRKVTAIVSWEDKKVEIVTYLTNWKE